MIISNTDNAYYSNITNTETEIINFAINLQNTITQFPLPPHCTLLPRQDIYDSSVIIEFVHPGSNRTGSAIMYKPTMENGYYGEGFIEMMCSIDGFNGYYIEMMVNSVYEMFEVIQFSQQLLQYQPNTTQLEYVHVPLHLLNHWCVQPRLRALNLEMQNRPYRPTH